jgi:chromosome partitioning protein
MKIVFGNQKGGVGKSTLCVLMANYLTLEKKKDVLVFDMDMQKSISERRPADKSSTNLPMPYEIVAMEMEDYPRFSDDLKKLGGEVFALIDLAGSIHNDDIIPIIQEADYVFCPFDYEQTVFASTITFAKLVKYLSPDKPLFFIPNRIKTSINYDLQDVIDTELRKYGILTKPITDRVTLKRINTFSINEEQKRLLEDVFGFLYSKIN